MAKRKTGTVRTENTNGIASTRRDDNKEAPAIKSGKPNTGLLEAGKEAGGIYEDGKAERELVRWMSHLEHRDAKRAGRVSQRELRKAIRTIAKFIVENRPPEDGHTVSAVSEKLDHLIASSADVLLGVIRRSVGESKRAI